MRIYRLSLASLCFLAIAGCEGGSPSGPGVSGPPPTYEDISGDYSALVTASSPGLVLTGTMYLFVNQNDSTFRGSYAVVGTLEEGLASESVTLLGSVVNGTLALGKDPTLQLELNPTGCGLTFILNAGSYSSSDQSITLSPATIPVQALDCSEILRTVTDTLTFTP